MNYQLNFAVLALFLAFSSSANEWIDIHPEDPALSLGGAAEYIGYSPYLEQQFLLSENSNTFRRGSSSEVWAAYTPQLTSGQRVYPSNMLFDSASPDHITAESNGSIIASEDGGYIWERIYFGIVDGPRITLMAAAPSDSNVLYGWAAQTKEIARSSDRGDTWTFIPSDFDVLRSVNIHPGNPDILFALNLQRLSKSIDGGVTWTVIEEGTGTYWYMDDLIMDPLNPDTLYASSGALPRIYKTINGGQLWTQVNPTPIALNRTLRHLILDTSQSGTLYGANSIGGIVKSADDGVTWEAYSASRNYPQFGHLVQTSPDELLLASPTGVVTATAAGVQDSNAGYTQFTINDIECAGVDCSYQYGSNSESGFIYNTPGTQDWQVAVGEFGSEVFSITLNPQDPENVFLSTAEGLWESMDAGVTWNMLPTGLGRVLDLIVSPTNPDLMFAQSFNGMKKSVDGGATWSETLIDGIFNGCCGNQPLVVSPVNNDYLVMGTTNSGIYRSTDGGITWEAQTDVLAGFQSTSDLQMNPNNPDHLILVQSYGEGMWQSYDFGETWSSMPLEGIASSLFSPELIFDSFIDGRIFLLSSSGGIVYVYDVEEELWSQVTPNGIEYSFCGYECAFDPVANIQGRFITNLGARFHIIDIDSDQDGVIESEDNCTIIANSNQRDTDGDALGNACDPDLNNDNAVNFLDLSLLSQRFLTNDPDADFDGDGVVNFVDISIFREFFNQPPGPGAHGQ